MSKVIIDNVIVDDDWALVTYADTDLASLKKIIVPLKIWASKPAALNGKTIGVFLDGADDPGALAAEIKTLPLIAVNFPTFKDGRGYSTA